MADDNDLLLGDDFGEAVEKKQPRTDLSSASGGKVDMDFFRGRDKADKEGKDGVGPLGGGKKPERKSMYDLSKKHIADMKSSQERPDWSRFGWSIPPQGLVMVNFDSLEVILGKIGETLISHENMMKKPKWMDTVFTKLSEFDKLQQDFIELSQKVAALSAGGIRRRKKKKGKKAKTEPTSPVPAPAPAPDQAAEEGGDDAAEAAKPAAAAAASASAAAELSSSDWEDDDEAMATLGQLQKTQPGQVELDALQQRLDRLQRDIMNKEMSQKLELASAQEAQTIEIQRLARRVEASPSANDIKAAQEYHEGLIKELKDGLLTQIRQTEARLDGRVQGDLDKLEAWKAHLTDSFKKRNALVEDTMRKVQGDLAAANSGMQGGVKLLTNVVNQNAEVVKKVLEKHQKQLVDIKRVAEEHFVKHTNTADKNFHALQKEIHALGVVIVEKTDQLSGETEGLRQSVSAQEDAIMGHEGHLAKLDGDLSVLGARVGELEGPDKEELMEKFNVHMMKIKKGEQVSKQLDEQIESLRNADIPSVRTMVSDLAQLKLETDNWFRDKLTEHKLEDERLGKMIDESVASAAAAVASISEVAEVGVRRDSQLAEVVQRTAAVEGRSNLMRGRVSELERDVESLQPLQTASSAASSQLERLFRNAEEMKEELSVLHNTSDTHHAKAERLLDSIPKTFESNLAVLRQSVNDVLQEHQEHLEELQSSVDAHSLAVVEVKERVQENNERDKIKSNTTKQQKYVRHQLVDMCLEFEESTQSSSSGPRLSQDLARELAAQALELAKLFCGKADFEAILSLVQGNKAGQGGGGGGVYEYEQEGPDETRTRLMNGFLDNLLAEVNKAYPNPNRARLDARAKFRAQMTRALQVAMTKFEQVVVTADTRLGRVPFTPVCVACDRPLGTTRKAVAKGSKAAAAAAAAVQGGAGAGAGGGGGQQTKEAVPEHRDDRPVEGTYVPGRSGGGYKGSSSEAQESSRPVATPGGAGPYVYRGGFRMPKDGAKWADGEGSAEFGELSVGSSSSVHRPMTSPARDLGVSSSLDRLPKLKKKTGGKYGAS